jgi:large subunit ribosomal protein L13
MELDRRVRNALRPIGARDRSRRASDPPARKCLMTRDSTDTLLRPGILSGSRPGLSASPFHSSAPPANESFDPNMSTTHVRSADLAERWIEYDASQHTLGRLAAQIAMNLMGKDVPQYTASEMNGAFVVVVNAEKVRVTGNKREQKNYVHYSGYPGGQKHVPFADLHARRPDDILRQAVKRMLPKSVLGRDMQRRLKIYAGPDHPHAAQKPTKVDTIRS